MARDPLKALRRICLSLPKVTERLSHSEPTWFVQDKKTFVMYANHHHDNRLAFWCAAPRDAQETLVAADPERFFMPPYVGHRGWLGVYLDVPVDWGQIAELVVDAYREVAPKRLLAELEGHETKAPSHRGKKTRSPGEAGGEDRTAGLGERRDFPSIFVCRYSLRW
jgi:hypothetical protein